MTQFQSDRALSSAHRNANPNPRHGGKEKKAMRRSLNLAAIVAVFIMVVASLTGCVGDEPATDFQNPAMTATAYWPAVCEDGNIPDVNKPGNCNETLTIEVAYKMGDKDGNGVKDVSRESKELVRTSGELKASVPFSPPPVHERQYIVASLSYSGITLGEDDVMETCEGASLPSSIELLPDQPTELCIRIVNHDNGTSAGSGKGDVCVGVTNADGAVDASTCNFAVDGKAVTPDADANGLCPDGALLKGLAAKVSVIAATCGEESGSMSTEVAEDSLTDVSVEVAVPSSGTTGDVTVSVKDSNQSPLSNCTFDWWQLADDPTPAANGGDYIFTGVEEGLYELTATCGSLSGKRKVEVVAGESRHFWITLLTPVPDGQFCVGKLGLPIDLDTPSADMGVYLGYGSGGACVPASASELAGMSVLDFSQTFGPGNCTDMNDPSCAISVAGLVVSMPSGFDGYANGEERVFDVTVEDGSQHTVHVFVDTVNGYFQP